MRLYVWQSEACRNYATGHVLAVADSADAARVLARAALTVWVKENRFFGDIDGGPDDQEDWAKLTALIEKDLAATPTETDSLVVRGSE